jgi:GT2 family glycosyltransferase
MARILLVIPNLNQGKYLGKNLERLFSGDVSDISVVLMDAGSTDSSLEIIGKYKDRFRYWRSHPDAGQSAAINEGMRTADTEQYVCWVNADDIVMPDRLIDLARFLDEHSQYVAVHGQGEIIDERGTVIGMHYSRPFSLRIFASFNTICQPASLVRRSAWERVAGVDENLHFGMDYDLWWKLARIGKIGFVDEVVAQYREHAETKTRSRYRQAVETAIDIVRTYCGYVPLLWIARLAHINRASTRGHQEDITTLSLIKKIAVLAVSLWRFPGINGPDGLINCVSFMLAPNRTIKRE